METDPTSERKTPQAVPTSALARPSCWTALQRWVLLAGLAYIFLISAVRLVTTIDYWYWLDFAKVSPGPLYLAFTGGLWAVIALAALLWVGLRRPWFRLVGFSAALFFALTYWIDRLFISTHPDGTGNTPFAILLTLILLAYVALALRPLAELRALKSK